MGKVVFAISAHPDDIEWTMAGTMLLLKQKGCSLHYMTIANGCYGTETHSKEEITAMRRGEARAAASHMGAEFHESITDDFEIFYIPEQIRRVAAVVRAVAPDIILTHPLEDYMEDHINAARLVCSAAFIRSSANYRTEPPAGPVRNEVAVYHTLPHGLRDRMKIPAFAERYVDISSVIEEKKALIAFHKSQEAWLGQTQGTTTLADNMTADSRSVGELSLRYTYAEGWTRHLHIGYSANEIDPLAALLSDYIS